jgi:hypothetical protein
MWIRVRGPFAERFDQSLVCVGSAGKVGDDTHGSPSLVGVAPMKPVQPELIVVR